MTSAHVCKAELSPYTFSGLSAPREGRHVLQCLQRQREQPGPAGQAARGGGQGLQVSRYLKHSSRVHEP